MPSILMKRLDRDLKADAMWVDACALSADWEAERSKKGETPRFSVDYKAESANC